MAFSAISSYLPDWCQTVFQKNSPSQDIILVEGATINIIIPKRPLAIGSVQLVQSSTSMLQLDQKEAYAFHQKVIQVFAKQGITDYLRYTKVSSILECNWEIVPFSKSSWSFWQQLKVLWNVTFSGLFISQNHRQRITESFQQADAKESQQTSSNEVENDAFCNKDVIDKQCVFRGKFLNILYNYAPIGLGKKKLHFLLVPNQHREKFSDLTVEEYKEAQDLLEKLLRFYKNKDKNKENFAAYVFDKTGSRAGQTILHWHQHVVFTTTKLQGIWGKLIVLKNMLFGSSALSNKNLKKKVARFKKELKALQ